MSEMSARFPLPEGGNYQDLAVLFEGKAIKVFLLPSEFSSGGAGGVTIECDQGILGALAEWIETRSAAPASPQDETKKGEFQVTEGSAGDLDRVVAALRQADWTQESLQA